MLTASEIRHPAAPIPPPVPRARKYKDRWNNVTVKVSLPDTKPVLVCSIYPRPFTVSSQHSPRGYFYLPEKPKDADYSCILIGPGVHNEDKGDGKRTKDFCIPSRKVATSLFTERGDHAYVSRGIFVAEGDKATPEELEAARQKLNEYWHRSLDRGKAAFQNRQRITDVPDEAKLAALALNVKAPWSPEAVTNTECPACAESVKDGAAICKHCGFIINRDRALAIGHIKPPEVVKQRELSK